MLSLMCVCYTLLLRSSSALSSQFFFNCLVFSSRLILSFFSPNKNWYHCSFPSLLLPLAVPALSVVNALKKRKRRSPFFPLECFVHPLHPFFPLRCFTAFARRLWKQFCQINLILFHCLLSDIHNPAQSLSHSPFLSLSPLCSLVAVRTYCSTLMTVLSGQLCTRGLKRWDIDTLSIMSLTSYYQRKVLLHLLIHMSSLVLIFTFKSLDHTFLALLRIKKSCP